MSSDGPSRTTTTTEAATASTAATATTTKASPRLSSSSRARLRVVLRGMKDRVKNAFAGFGFVTVAYLAYYRYWDYYDDDDDDYKKKRNVLVIPFNRLRLVDETRNDSFFGAGGESLFERILGSGDDESTRVVTMRVRDFVHLIHEASSDEEICALYGVFGPEVVDGRAGIASAGWATAEEVRTALRVFRESHRVHTEPNLGYRDASNETVVPLKSPKPMYCYSDTFADMVGSGNKSYYVASAFNSIHLRDAGNTGELNLTGLSSQTFFIRGLLEKYGIQAHVFKHGKYKNSPNSFTESKYTREHRANAQNIVHAIDASVCREITESRSESSSPFRLFRDVIDGKKNSKSRTRGTRGGGSGGGSRGEEEENKKVLNQEDLNQLWKRIHSAGTFSAEDALRAGFVDFLPRRDPLFDLVKSNNNNRSSAAAVGEGDEDGGSKWRSWTRRVALQRLMQKYVGPPPKSGGGDDDDDSTTTTSTSTTGGSTSTAATEEEEEEEENKNKKKKSPKDEVKEQWGVRETDFDRFPADHILHLTDYAERTAKRAKRKEKQLKRQSRRKYIREKVPGFAYALSQIGLLDPPKKAHEEKDDDDAAAAAASKKKKEEERGKREKEYVALLNIQGSIDDAAAAKLVSSVRKIRDENENEKNSDDRRRSSSCKCIVLRVNSPGGVGGACETIAQELKAPGVPPVVVSFGNVAASGGYYISAAAERIFASDKTVTGSVGVFGVRFDFTELAARYGITVKQLTAPGGEQTAGLMDPLLPMTRAQKEYVAASVDRSYARFKSIVSEGRNIPLEDVEAVAAGRLWTGGQAKLNGLADEIGGLSRALAYAKRTYCTSPEDAKVVSWPKPKSFFERWKSARSQLNRSVVTAAAQAIREGLEEEYYRYWNDRAEQETMTADDGGSWPPSCVIPTEACIAEWIINAQQRGGGGLASGGGCGGRCGGLPGTFSGVLLTADENAAIRCLMQSSLAAADDGRRSSGGMMPRKTRPTSSSFPLPPDFWE